MNPTAAFLDLDNTLIQGSSLWHLARGLVARGVVSRRDLIRHGWRQLLFRTYGEHASLVVQIQRVALSIGADCRVADLLRMGEEIYDERLADRVWPGARSVTENHLAAGEQVWLVTASPVEFAEIIARRLLLTGALGTTTEVVEGAWTGKLVGDLLHGRAKAVAVVDLAKRHDLDLPRCTAYSDSINDLPLLELVGRPCAVNPDRRLRQIAAHRDWPILDFRSPRSSGLGTAWPTFPSRADRHACEARAMSKTAGRSFARGILPRWLTAPARPRARTDR